VSWRDRTPAALAGIFAAVIANTSRVGAQDTASTSAAQRATAESVPSSCPVDTLDAGFPRRWLGTTVGQITVRARNVETPIKIANTLAHYVHRSTQLNVALNELSFTPGVPVDSLEIKDSIRRLRATRIYSEVILEGTVCGGVTSFTLWTRDAWSLKSSLRFSDAGSSRVSLSEVNLLGTGRAIAVAGDNIDGRNSLSFSVIDPHLFDTRFRAAGQLRAFSDGRAWTWSLRTREESDRDVWRAALTSTQQRRLGSDSATGTTVDITKRADAFTLSRLVVLGATAAYTVVAGGEEELTNERATQPGGSLSANAAQRHFAAPLLGVSRRSRRYGAIDWLVPGQASAELREGLEGEAVFGVGHDLFRDATITHLDAWVGITEMFGPNTVFTGDIWTSGYHTADSLQNGTVRTSITVIRKARNGMWVLRGGWEHIYNPDPDVFALSTVDPLLRVLAPTSRLAEQALNATLERSVHMYAKEGRWVLDGAAFVALSDRHRSFDGLALDPMNYRAMIVGIGVRQVRDQPTQAPIRLDIGRAVWRSAGLPNRWILSLTTTPWLNAGRMRDGLREVR
jgi:hypothetical protein